MPDKPRVAVLCTVWFPGSHADVIVGRLLNGYDFDGVHQQARIEVASVYLEQLGSHDWEPTSRTDIGVDACRRHGVPMFETVGEALSLGGSGVAVDGVLIIGEHGDYGWGEFEQKLYPRRRMFDASVAAMVAAGRTVPVFVDKHLAWTFTDAAKMVADAARLGIPLLAGSSLPVAWRTPTGANWPLGAPASEAVVVGVAATEPGARPTELNCWHYLEFAQAFLERRAGGETGVATVAAVTGSAVDSTIALKLGRSELLRAAIAALDIETDDPVALARQCANDLFLVRYADGTSLTLLNLDLHDNRTAVAIRGAEDTVVASAWTRDPHHGHFTFLVRQIESLVLTGRSPYPVDRTLLTTGVIQAALVARHEQRLVQTPHLALSYTPAESVPDTGVDRPIPEPGR